MIIKETSHPIRIEDVFKLEPVISVEELKEQKNEGFKQKI